MTFENVPKAIAELLSKVDELSIKVDQLNNNQPSTPERMTRKEVAELCRVHTNTVGNWVKDGLLKQHQAGGKFHFLRSEVLELLNKPNG